MNRKASFSVAAESFRSVTVSDGTIWVLTDDGSLYYCSKRIDACEAGILGDVNLDGSADAEDSVLVNCIIVGLLTQADLEPIRYAAADYDFDGSITEADVTALEKAGLLGTVSTLNAEQDIRVIK